MKLAKYSIGIGDRFGHQGQAQLAALQQAATQGIQITPVWNKSFREHQIIGSTPQETRRAAEQAVRAADWSAPYFVDADHIGWRTVPGFISFCDYFTVDVAEEIGKPVGESKLREFLQFCERFTRTFRIPGIVCEIDVDRGKVETIAHQYLAGVLEVKRIYQKLRSEIRQPFIIELSIDETEYPQRPVDLFFILAAAAWQELPLDTIAPKFSGRFNKGVDYVGDLQQFAREFEEDVLVIRYAVQEFALPAELKLSIHSGSDKFSIYPFIRNIIRKYDIGVHLKTAGTTWLEELIGLAEAGSEGFSLVKNIYQQAYKRIDELVKPYVTVLDINRKLLPAPETVAKWTAPQLVAAIRHIPAEPKYNPHLRQLLHVGYKIAAELGKDYYTGLIQYRDSIAPNVTENLFQRHIVPLFRV